MNFAILLFALVLVVSIVFILTPKSQALQQGTYLYSVPTIGTNQGSDSYLLISKDSISEAIIPNKSPSEFSTRDNLNYSFTNLTFADKPVVRLEKDNILFGFDQNRDIAFDLEVQANKPVVSGMTKTYKRISPKVLSRGQIIETTMSR